jgi:pimeloyl-ACP methyl ester carboxylesterase
MTVRRSYLSVGDTQLHLRRTGPLHGVPVLLLHQVPSSGAMFEAIMAPLAALGYRVTAVDLPGYGMSDPIGDLPSLDDYAQVIAGLLDALDVASCHVIGHHTGAGVALALARAQPHRVAALALWGVPMIEGDLAHELATEDAPDFTADYATAMAASWTTWWGLCDPAVASHVVPRNQAEILLCGAHRPDGHRAVGREDTVALVRAVPHPVLAMCGSNEMLHDETVASIGVFANATLADIRDLGIDAFDVAPDELCELMHGFFSTNDRG